MQKNRSLRAGLVATQAIRGPANREVLKKILQTGRIFWAISDRDWVLAGASVHISLIAFEAEGQTEAVLNKVAVANINANLTANADTTQAIALDENAGICFIGTQKGGSFELDASTAARMLKQPVNVNGRLNSDVIRPWINGLDLTRRPRGMYVIDFGSTMVETEASKYEMPFEYIRERVRPNRVLVRRDNHAKRWWLHAEARPGMRRALNGLDRYIATPRLTKHRLFVYVPATVLPDSQVFIFGRNDDYFFGVLHSRVHELWALAQGTQLEDRPRYTPNTTFDTFPFPWPPGTEPKNDPRVQAIAAAAKHLVDLRDRWLNPPDTPEADLKKRTLTNLYNDTKNNPKPQWLIDAHQTLDHAVFAAYNWPPTLTTQQILENLLTLNHQRAARSANA